MINHIDLLIDEHAEKEKTDDNILRLETYFIINYINRNIKKYKLVFDEVTTLNIVIGGKKDHIEHNKKWPDTKKFLICITTHSYNEIKPLKGTERVEKFLSILENSAENCEKYIEGISSSMKEIIERFRGEKYKNIWVYKKKKIKKMGIIELQCQLTNIKFYLNLILNDGENIIYRKKLLETRPNPYLYYNLFKEIVEKNDSIYLNERILNKPFFSISYDQILKGDEGVFCKKHPSNPDYIYEPFNKTYIYKDEETYKNKKGTRWWHDFKKQHDEIA